RAKMDLLTLKFANQVHKPLHRSAKSIQLPNHEGIRLAEV
ncbi:MAG: hypothetical protein QOE55_8446, partial [Acidobacteriaceae bacterium]|nr:hypothetical protein [Acidobacteriaceae bacterium]